MTNYYRVMLGAGSSHAQECVAGGFIATHYGFDMDLTHELPENWRDFNQTFIPIFIEKWPGKTKIAAGLACGGVWTLCKGILQGDIVLSPDGTGRYHVGEVVSDYYFEPTASFFPHRRRANWFDQTIERADMSEALQASTRSSGMIINITKYADEIEQLLSGRAPAKLIVNDETIEDPLAFAMEKHLEDFLISNWAYTELGRDYAIYEEDGVLVGQQFPTDTGPMDILAISKDQRTLLVVELKRGRASDAVIGQILRYMDYVDEELAEDNQTVRGVIIGLEDSQKMRRALRRVADVDFYRYEISFRLIKE